MFTCCANSSFEYEHNPNSTSATYSAYYYGCTIADCIYMTLLIIGYTKVHNYSHKCWLLHFYVSTNRFFMVLSLIFEPSESITSYILDKSKIDFIFYHPGIPFSPF